MGILENFEAWVNFDDDDSSLDDNLALKIFKEDVCENCGCKDEQSIKDLLSPEEPRQS
jgi:hypothetical protein